MTTAYTSLLGLALPVTGELSGTWGDTVNNSITSLLDTSVAGTTNVSTDTDVTLTTTTGAANTARQAILLFSGARTALRTVTAPAQSKVYTVINATTGGFSVKLVGSGPTTGLTIPNGASAVVAWNGSDFVEIGAGSIGNLVVNGTLTVTGATTLQSTLAVTGNITNTAGTANGVAYLNGSKVVTSGSALTFDGTNFATPAAQLTLASNVSSLDAYNYDLKVMSVRAGGIGGKISLFTGTGTTVERYSIDKDGIAVWTIGSEQMRLTSTGLGIGTSSPNISGVTEALTVNGSDAIIEVANGGTLRASLYGNSSGAALSGVGSVGLRFYTSSSGATTLAATIDTAQNFGLGVTPSAWISSLKSMQLNAQGVFAAGGTTNYMGVNWYVNSSSQNTYIGTGAATLYGQSGGAHQWFNAPSGTAGNAITFTQAMTLDASGNLGIGTTTATGFTKTIRLNTASGTAGMLLCDADTDRAGFYIDAGTTAPAYLFTNNSKPLVFSVAGSERARIDSSGNFGINDSNPQSKLSIAFSTTQSGIKCAPVSFVYPDYSVLTTGGVVSTIKAGSGTIRLVDIRAEEQTATANGQLIGGYFQVNSPNAAVNLNGGQIALYGVANNISSYTTGHNYGVFGRNGGGGTYGIGVVAQLGAENAQAYKAALVAVTDDTTNPIAVFANGAGEKARFNGSGNLLVGTTTAPSSNRLSIGVTDNAGVAAVPLTSLAQNAYVDININNAVGGANMAVQLIVSNVLIANAGYRTSSIISVFDRGLNNTSINTISTANGGTGSASFTVTVPSSGVIRITNTYAGTTSLSAFATILAGF